MVHGASSGISSGVSLFLRELTLEMCVAIWNLDALEQLEEEEQQQRDRFVHGGTIIKEDDPIESFSLLEDEVNGATTTTIRSSSTTTTSTTSTSTSTTTFTTESKRRTSIHRSIGEQVQIGDQLYEIPLIPEKFKRFLINRKSIYREIAHMHRLTGTTIDGSFYSSNGNGTSGHENVLKLFDVLEFIQASKSTIFLVLELAHGGELFDRIKALKPTELGQQASSQENLARKYFTQLVSGVLYCHELGIVHRDLKPENLLLSEKDVLKIADFGLSAHFIAAVSHTTSTPSPCLGPLNVEELNNNQRELEELRLTPSQQQTKEKELPSKSTSTSTSMSSCNFSSSSLPVTRCFRRLNSVVGTPHYVAPEVLQTSAYGYDGRKADMWSMGVILYGLLMGSLPFGKELSQCPRYFKFSEWIRTLPSDSQTSKLIYEPSFYQETIHTAKNPHTNENDVHDFNQSIEEDFLSNQQNHPHLFPSSQQQPLRQYTKMSRRSTCSSVVMNFPSWFFPSRISSSAVFLLANLLHPDPARRFSCEEVCKASWIMEDSQQQQEEEQQQQQQQQQENQLPYHHQVNDLFLSF
jgi:serine/threonine protein kinase